MSSIALVVGVGAAAGLAGAYMQSQATTNAANTQSGASAAASAQSQYQYDQTRADNEPYRYAGYGALNALQGMDYSTFNQGKFQADPGYQFRLDEGNKAINAAASARGMANSGATMKALTNYGQNSASAEYSKAYDRYNNDQTNRFNRMAAMAGVGQTANGLTSAAGSANSANISNNLMATANANSAAQIGSANAYSNAIGQTANAYTNYQTMQLLAGKKS